MDKKTKKLRDAVEAVQENMSDADEANQDAILHLLDAVDVLGKEVETLKQEIAALKKK